MDKYECTVCGYIYDEDAEGTKFEDLPDDYTCPVCGVGKDMFEKMKDYYNTFFIFIFYVQRTHKALIFNLLG